MESFQTDNKLHTDVLEEKYGEIHAIVLRHDDEIRESHLADKNGVSRTYAITFLNKFSNPEIATINNEIKNGEAIGRAFRKYGYSIRKNVIGIYIIKIPKWLRDAFKTKKTKAKARLAEFYICRNNDKPEIYGTAVEIYSPDFKKAEIDLNEKEQINPTTKEFEKIGVSKKEIWKRLGTGNDWKDLKNKYEKAKRASSSYVKDIKKKIEEIMRFRR